MVMTDAERQRRHRRKLALKGDHARINMTIPHESAIKLQYLSQHWRCTRKAALERLLLEAWDRAGRPIPGHRWEGD